MADGGHGDSVNLTLLQDKTTATFFEKRHLGEQSTVTVLVASAFCCCFLFLTCIAMGCGYMFLLMWGAYILDNDDSAKTSICEDEYHIWTFCLLNEIVGVSVTLCGCWEACRAYDNMKSDSSDESAMRQPGPAFYAKYGLCILVAFVFFTWGMIGWFSVSDSCIDEYNNKYQALMLLFRAGVMADAVILLIATAAFVIQNPAKKNNDQPGKD